jgi:hypothetical protein
MRLRKKNGMEDQDRLSFEESVIFSWFRPRKSNMAREFTAVKNAILLCMK